MGYRVLIVGGAGFIGSHVTDLFVAREHEVTVFDNLDPQVHGAGAEQPAFLHPAARFARGDVRDRDALAPHLLACDLLVYLAAAVGIGQSMYQIARYTSVNALGAATALDLIAAERSSLRLRRMVVAGSMSVYGEGLCRCPRHGAFAPASRPREQLAAGRFAVECPQCGAPSPQAPTPESTRLAPTSIYAIGKRDHEEMFLATGAAYRIPTVALRYFNAIGPRQAPGNPYTGVSTIFAARLLSGNPPVIYEDGGQTRDIVHVADIARATLAAAEAQDPGGEVFNVGSGRAVSVNEVAAAVADALERAGVAGAGAIAPRVTGAFREGDIRNCTADISRLRARYGYAPARTFEEGVADMVAFLRANPGAAAGGGAGFDEAQRALARHGLLTDGK